MNNKKLTKEQISNWRRVLLTMVGPYAMLMPDADVEKFASKIQSKIYETELYTWDVKVLFKEDLGIPWSDIKPEPTHPTTTANKMFAKCASMLKKHKNIHEFRVSIGNNDAWIVGRSGVHEEMAESN